METMVGFGLFILFDHSPDICGRFELSKNVIGGLFSKDELFKMLAKNLVKNDQKVS